MESAMISAGEVERRLRASVPGVEALAVAERHALIRLGLAARDDGLRARHAEDRARKDALRKRRGAAADAAGDRLAAP